MDRVVMWAATAWPVSNTSPCYTCLETAPDGDVFRYGSSSFRRDLRIDPDGLVVDYPGFWRRVET